MMLLQSDHHSDQVLAALQNQNGRDILLTGNDNRSSQSDSLWILSPLVRSIIGSLGAIRDNLIILPDFCHEDIKTALDIIDGVNESESSLFFFNSTTNDLLQSLGIHLKKTKTFNIRPGDAWGDCLDRENNSEHLPSPGMNVEREDVDEQDKVQEMLLVDSSDYEDDAQSGYVTVKERLPGVNRVSDDYNDFQDLLLLEQDLSDSDDDSDERMTIPVQYDKTGTVEESRLTQDHHKNYDISEDEDEDERDITETVDEVSDDRSDVQQPNLITTEPTVKLEKLRLNAEGFSTMLARTRYSEKHRRDTKVENIGDVEVADSLIGPTETEKNKFEDLHQQALKKVKNFAIEENGRWKCSECGKQFSSRNNVLNHAEVHVSGLYYPCNNCTKTFNTRSRLAEHRFSQHQDKVKKHRKK